MNGKRTPGHGQQGLGMIPEPGTGAERAAPAPALHVTYSIEPFKEGLPVECIITRHARLRRWAQD